MATVDEDVRPLSSRFTEPATRDVMEAIRFLTESPGGEESARRFAAKLKELVESLRVRVAEEIESLGRPFDETNEAASLRYSRPVYRERLLTNRSRSRRSSSGLWYVYFTLEDRGGLGHADTLAVLTVRHSAARPLSIEGDVDADSEGADD